MINFYHFDTQPRFPKFVCNEGANLGLLLYGGVFRDAVQQFPDNEKCKTFLICALICRWNE